MKIEHFFYGMVDGKICLIKSPGINDLLTDKNFQYLRKLTVEDSDKYLWLPTEQIIALPHIEKVEDGNGREWIKNHTLLIRIHDYIRLTNPSLHLGSYLQLNPEFPEKFETITIEESK